MTRFCIDASVLIQAKNGPYRFSVVPQYWDLLETEIGNGRVYCPRSVYDELVRGSDELANWAKKQNGKGDFGIQPSAEVQQLLARISAYVMSEYAQHHAQQFLSGADPWLIAQACEDGSTLVTMETAVNQASQKPKIPNIWNMWCPDRKCIDGYDLLERLGGLSLAN